MSPRLLDLFSGAGGAAVGYARAGFEVVGVDIKPQPHYPFEFVQADAMDCLANLGSLHTNWGGIRRGFDVIHASPPCQFYSFMSACRPTLAKRYPALIDLVRERITDTGLPYVIENVVGAPLKDPVMLCGQMLGLDLYRHRLFESNVALVAPGHPVHTMPASRAGHWTPGTVMSVAGHIAPIAHARKIMGIDWTTREELAEAVPPAYTEFIGAQLLSYVTDTAVLREGT